MHISVLSKEIIDLLDLKDGDVFIDGTLGLGGHTKDLLDKHNGNLKVFAFDLDGESIDLAQKKLSDAGYKIQVFQRNFKDMKSVLNQNNVEGVDGILLDLGFNSYQMDHSSRGLSFQKNEPLKMTLSNDETLITAKVVVNEWSEDTLKSIIRTFGEERYAGRIASAIVRAREEREIETTQDLVEIIEHVVPESYKRQRIHPATRTFQALRIVVNQEMENLEKGLRDGFEILNKDGKMAIISFHSLEDRMVKRFFREKAQEGFGELITKKPIVATEEETRENPRSRSAKLRIIKKVK